MMKAHETIYTGNYDDGELFLTRMDDVIICTREDLQKLVIRARKRDTNYKSPEKVVTEFLADEQGK